MLDSKTVRVNPLASDGHVTPRDGAARRFTKAGVELELTAENLRRVWRATAPAEGDAERLYAEGFKMADAFIAGDEFLAFLPGG